MARQPQPPTALDRPGQRCSACEGNGWYYIGDWSQGYPKGKCQVCKGSGRMERGPDGRWGPAKGSS